MSEAILVTGAAGGNQGSTGFRVTQLLREQGHTVRALVHRLDAHDRAGRPRDILGNFDQPLFDDGGNAHGGKIAACRRLCQPVFNRQHRAILKDDGNRLAARQFDEIGFGHCASLTKFGSTRKVSCEIRDAVFTPAG